MKVGDLVKFTAEVLGMDGMRGIVLSFSGSEPTCRKYPVIAWVGKANPTQELSDFLEIVNKS